MDTTFIITTTNKIISVKEKRILCLIDIWRSFIFSLILIFGLFIVKYLVPIWVLGSYAELSAKGAGFAPCITITGTRLLFL
jgi:hypothetical protein